MAYNEDLLVQATTADYLEQELGWESVYAHNSETFGEDGLLGRANDGEVVLVRYLRRALKSLNPNLPEAAYDDAVREVVATTTSKDLVTTNRDKYALIRDGVSVTFQNTQGRQETKRLRVIDFNNPDANHFVCVRELWVRGSLYRRRADIVGFVNGLPLLFVELKNIHRDLKAAFEGNYADYKTTIPQLFHHNAIVMFGNGAQAKIGSITSQWGHFHEWKRLDEEEKGRVDMETLLMGVCSRENFLDILENFILFDESSGRLRKILARNHQFLGVNRAVEAVRERKTRKNKLGVFWHTQGAGKSYSMVMFTRKVHRLLGGNFTFLVLTDRDDLDSQIYKTFVGCGVANHDTEPCRAASGEHLQQLLGEHKKHVFSLIQKFNNPDDAGAVYSDRDDVIVISDEAHRTQYGIFARHMRAALPNASYIGFTGTPLFKDDELTRKVFGDYVSTYDFQRAVEDGATVPLYYDARGDDLQITTDDLNQQIADKLAELEIDDINVQQRLEQALGQNYHIITASERLDQIAQDFVQHYAKAWENGKVMLVCIDKITCVRMHKLIKFYWDEHVKKLLRQRFNDEQEQAFHERKIGWMQETQMAVVISEEQGEVEKFQKWDLDITPHRKLMKEGMELPEAMRQLPQFANMQRLPLEDAFKESEHPFRIAIVCAMWLTGFDVPSLSTLYLDKPLKAHTLMQAIARANRVYEGKNNGWIVDYCGILKNLREALVVFTQREGSKKKIEPAKPDAELLADLEKAIQLVRDFLKARKAPLDDVINSKGFDRTAAIEACKNAINESDESRKHFEIMAREVFRKFKACINVAKVDAFRPDYDAINIVYKSLQRDKEQADISDIIQQLHDIVDDAIATHPDAVREEKSEAYDISKIDFERLRKEFPRRCKHMNTAVQNLKNALEKRLQKMLEQNPLRMDLQERFEELVAEYNSEKDRATIEKTFEELLNFLEKLTEEQQRAAVEEMTEEQLAVFDLLKKDKLTQAERESIKKIAGELLETLKASEFLQADNWRDRESSRDGVRQAIDNYLWKKLPQEQYSEGDIEQLTTNVYQHIFRVYPTLPSPLYATSEVA